MKIYLKPSNKMIQVDYCFDEDSEPPTLLGIEILTDDTLHRSYFILHWEEAELLGEALLDLTANRAEV